MASVKAIDIPDEQKMMVAVWEAYKKYYYPESDDTWWQEMMNSFRGIFIEYPSELCSQICADFILSIKRHSKDKERDGN